MRVVKLSLRRGELCATMAEMRIWLDERRFEPAVFSCREGDAGIVIRVDFPVATEAEAFAGHFHRRLDGSAVGGRQPGQRRDPASPAAGALAARLG